MFIFPSYFSLGRFSLYGGVATVVWTAMKEMVRMYSATMHVLPICIHCCNFRLCSRNSVTRRLFCSKKIKFSNGTVRSATGNVEHVFSDLLVKFYRQSGKIFGPWRQIPLSGFSLVFTTDYRSPSFCRPFFFLLGLLPLFSILRDTKT